MGRSAKVIIDTGWIYEIEKNIPKTAGKNKAGALGYQFAEYVEDAEDKLVYLYQPDCSLGSIETDIEYLAGLKRPSAQEIFDSADIVHWKTGEIYSELKKVDLIGILEGLKEVMNNYKENE